MSAEKLEFKKYWSTMMYRKTICSFPDYVTVVFCVKAVIIGNVLRGSWLDNWK